MEGDRGDGTSKGHHFRVDVAPWNGMSIRVVDFDEPAWTWFNTFTTSQMPSCNHWLWATRRVFRREPIPGVPGGPASPSTGPGASLYSRLPSLPPMPPTRPFFPCKVTALPAAGVIPTPISGYVRRSRWPPPAHSPAPPECVPALSPSPFAASPPRVPAWISQLLFRPPSPGFTHPQPRRPRQTRPATQTEELTSGVHTNRSRHPRCRGAATS